VPLPPLLDRLRLPVIGSPLFIASQPELVIAQCTAGIVGSFPALNARPKEELAVWLERITSALEEHRIRHPHAVVAPFAVNQIAHRSNDRLDHDIEVCLRFKVPITITSLRAPHDVVRAVHDYGGIVLHDVISVRHAEKALEAGVDGLILVCAGAGGHAGLLSPFALVGEVRRFFDGPIALAGAITKGEHVLAALATGADLAYMGTRFLAVQEANTRAEYRQAILDAKAADIVYTDLFTGVHGNYIKQSIVNAGFDPANLPRSDPSKMDFGSGGNSAKKIWRDIWGAGQGVGQIDAVPMVAEVVDQLEREYRAARERLMARS
jgi:nitronate monooxygenase